MKRITYLMLAAGALMLLFTTDINAQRRGGGGGGRGFSGGGGGGFSAPARQAAPQMQAARPATQAPHASQQPNNRTQFTGPGGGTGQAGKGSGSYTTKGGATVDYKGAAIGGTGAGGVSGGKYIGGVSITTAGGQTINKAGKGGAAVGPGGNAVAGKSSITGTSGPMGSGVAVNRGGVAVGPNGAVGGRAGVAVGPNGAAGYRSGAAVTSHGTYYRSAAAVSGQGVYVRAGCSAYHGCFTQSWYAHYPAAWVPGRWAVATAWTAATWAAVAGTGGYPAEPTSYDYGSSVVYQDDQVYVNGESAGTTEQYAEQASAIADTGKQAPAGKEDDWTPLGVFAMVMGEEKTSYNIFQLALNKDGVIRGNYYNALTDTTEPVSGAVDKKTQRAAWTVGDKKAPTYEAGIVNLTQDESTMMVHYSKDRSQQFTLVRIQQPEGEKPPAEAGK